VYESDFGWDLQDAVNRKVYLGHEVAMGGAVCHYDPPFPLYKGWVEFACLLPCEAGAVDLKLFKYCSLVPVPSPFSAVYLGLKVFQRIENLPRFLCGAGASGLETSTEAH
jgi:hypothetical protein